MRVCVMRALHACACQSGRPSVRHVHARLRACASKPHVSGCLLLRPLPACLFVCSSVCLFVRSLAFAGRDCRGIRSATQPAAAWASPAEQTAECSIEAAMPASRLPCGSPPPLQRAACGAQHTRLRRRCPSTLCASLAAAQPKPCARAPMHARTHAQQAVREHPPRLPRRLRDSD